MSCLVRATASKDRFVHNLERKLQEMESDAMRGRRIPSVQVSGNMLNWNPDGAFVKVIVRIGSSVVLDGMMFISNCPSEQYVDKAIWRIILNCAHLRNSIYEAHSILGTHVVDNR